MALPPTVFVVDDDPAVRDAMRLLLKSVNQPVACFASGQEFLAGYDPSAPGCLVLDLRLPDLDGLAVVQQLRERQVHLPTIVLTGHGDVPLAVRAMKAGVFDFMQKPFQDQALLERIYQALEKDARDRGDRARRAEAGARLALLTSREREVLDLVVRGRPSHAIAAELGISPATVEKHRVHIMTKMQAAGVPDLVRLALLAAPPEGSPTGAPPAPG
jgi:FixJ family two-component response regulator